MTSPRRMPTRRVARAVERLGHAAVWAGMYVAGALGALAVLAGTPAFPGDGRDALALLLALAMGVSVYLVDRVKLADRLLDPADRRAHPRRYAFVVRRRRLLRVVAAALGAGAAIGSLLLHPLLPLAVAGAYAGALIYAGVPARPAHRVGRVKDVLIVKNGAVAVSIAALAAALLLSVWRFEPGAAAPIRDALRALLPPAGILAAIVFADAALCDLDDVVADRRFGTRTIPGTASAGATWALAGVVHLAAGVVIVVAGRGAGATVLGAGLPATTLALWWRRPARVRDLVDMRLALLAVASLLASALA